MKNTTQGAFSAMLAAIGYGFLPYFTKLGLSYNLAPETLLFWRFALAGTVIVFVTLPFLKRNALSRQLPMLLTATGAGGLTVLVAWTSFIALDHVSASVYSLLFYSYPAAVAVLSVMLGKKLHRDMWFAILLALIGSTVVAGNNFVVSASRFMFLPVLNALLYAGYLVFIDHVVGQRADFLFSVTTIVAAGIFCIPLATVRAVTMPSSIAAWGALLGLAVICTVLPIVCTLAGVRRIGSTPAATLGVLEPLTSLVLAILLLGEKISWLQVIGGGVLLASSVLVQWRLANSAPKVSPCKIDIAPV